MNYRLIAVAAMVVAITVAIWVSVGRTRPTVRSAGVLESDWTADPIYTSADALARSLRRFPPGVAPYSETVRALSWSSYTEWGGTVGDPALAPATPVWLVGIRGLDLAVGQVMEGGLGLEPTDTTPALAAFYVWDATSGMLVEWGAMTEIDAFDRLVALSNQAISVSPATPHPLPPTYVPSDFPSATPGV
jgi:hypothetical protein